MRPIRSFIVGFAFGLAAAAAALVAVGLGGLGFAGKFARARAGPDVFLAFDPARLFQLAPLAAAVAVAVCLVAIVVYRKS
jgi:hypothetical protein